MLLQKSIKSDRICARSTRNLVTALALAVAINSALAADDLPTQQDGAGIPTLEEVHAVPGPVPDGPTRETTMGVSGGGARFSRPNSPREHGPNDSGREDPDDQDATDDCKDTKKSGNPVILGTGNKVETEYDFKSFGVASSTLLLKRTWNQHWYDVGLFGYHWISNFDYYLKFGQEGVTLCSPRPSVAGCTSSSSATYAWALRTDGRKIKFNKGADGIFREERASPVAYLVREANGTWTLHNETNGIEVYSASGFLLSKHDAEGIGIAFTYGGLNGTQLQRVTHTNGRYIDFVWTGDELREIKDPAGNTYLYSYVNQKAFDGYHNIGTVTYPGNPATTITYHYVDSAGGVGFSNFGGKSFNGVRYSTFGYNGTYAVSTEHAGGVERYTFAYTPGANDTLSVLETNPLNKQTTYDFQDGKLMTVTGHQSTHCPMTGKGNTYDANGNRDVITDENGNVTNYDYNAKGQLTKLVEASGKPEARTTTYTWDTAANRVKTITVSGLLKTEHFYEPDSRLDSIVVTNLSSNGVLNQTRTTAFSYTKYPSGLLATAKVDGPLPGIGDEITYTYNSTGDLIKVANNLGHATTYSNHNSLGLPGRIVGPNGDITDYVYDERGRVAEVRPTVNGAVQITKYYYDAMGHVILTIKPDGHWLGREYDAAGRMGSQYYPEAGGAYARTRYTYNNLSLPTKIETERVSGVTLSGPPPAVAPVLTAPASNTSGAYTVTWTTVAGAMTYVLDENLNGGPWAQIHNASPTSKALTAKPNGTYGYRARACTNAGCGPYSPTALTVVNNPLPLTPALTLPDFSTGSYTVTWGAVSNATSYQLDESADGGPWTQVYGGAGLALSRSKNSGDYSYRVRACNTNGCSANSPVQTIIVEKEYCPSCFMEPEPPQESSNADGEGV